MNINIIKSHGSGNDFILIDIRKNEKIFTNNIKKKISIKLCKRKSSIGADGILFIENSKNADCKMRIFNSDGSEAEMCGNGIRIVGRYICEYNKVNFGYVENITGLLYLIEREKDFFKNIIAYKVSFPMISFDACKLPINYNNEYLINGIIPEITDKYSFTGISMPNPHLIVNDTLIMENELIELGGKINKEKNIIPNGANLSFVKLINHSTVYVSTYERGVGITNSCGTAMCASVISLIKNKSLIINKKIKVLTNGGFVFVKVNNDFSCELTGNATYVFNATIDFNIDKMENLKFFKGSAYINEIMDYGELIDSTNTELKERNIK